MVWVDKMMMKRLLLFTLILALLGTPIVALASDISDADYYGIIQISNNSTATTNVATTCNISTQNLIDGNYLNSSANNCVLRTSSGADVPFMPSANSSYPFCLWVPSIGDYSYQSDILYTANSTGGEIRYFPGTGGMTTSDNETLELGDNFTIEQKGWVDTSYSANKTLVYKQDVFQTYISGANEVSSEITRTGESYTSGQDTDITIYVNIYKGQTFTPGSNVMLTKVEVYLKKAGTPTGTPELVVEETTGGKPNGTDLSSATISLDDIGDSYAWHAFDVTDVNLTGSTLYAIYIRGITSAPGGGIDWGGDGTSPTYDGGQYVYSSDGGSTWDTESGTDLLFKNTIGQRVTATGVSSGEHTVKTIQERSGTATWWDNDWTARKKLTFDNSASSENLTDFPVLIYLTTENFNFDCAQSNGEDIRFVNQSDNSTLDYEIERWTDSEAWIWVEVPQIDAGSTTDFIYIYYSNPSASDGQDVEGTWNSNYVLVQHLQEDPSGDTPQMIDSTSNDNDGTSAGSMTSDDQVLGQVDGSLDFDGSNDLIIADSVANGGFFGGAHTLIAWAKLAGWGAYRTLISGGRRDLTGYFTLLGYGTDNKLRAATMHSGVGQNEVVSASTYADDANFHFLAVTVDADGHINHFILDGTDEGNDSTYDNDLSTCYKFYIGQLPWTSPNLNAWSGLIDEVRVSDIERSEDWLKACYLSETDNFTTFGNEMLNRLSIYVDGDLKDQTWSATVPDNANNWTFVENYSMFYLESQEIEIDGMQAQYIEWEYDTTFHDLSDNSNDATPTFRTASSDADVSAELVSFQPVAEAKAPDYVLGQAPPFIDPGITGNVTGTFTTTPGAGTFPLAGVITEIAEATGTPPQLPLLVIAVFIILAASLSVSAVMRRYGSGSLIVKIIVITAVMGIFIALGNFAIDFWMLVVFLIIAVSLAMASRQMGFS